MRILRQPMRADERRRGAALMLSFLVLIVLIVIVQQISFSARTDARVSRNEEALIEMDQAIESVLLDAYEKLRTDGEASAESGAGGEDPFASALAEGGGEGGDSASVDSREDDWARPWRTSIGDLQVRVLIQDEDSKFNVLSLLKEDPEEARLAFERLERILEYARGGSRLAIDSSAARSMADDILQFMTRREDQVLPRPELLSDDEEEYDRGFPLTLREFVALDPELFTRDLFRDVRDEDGNVVHSLGSFMTVYSSLGTYGNQLAGSVGDPGGGPADEADEGDENSEETGDEGDGGPQGAEGEETADPGTEVPGAPPPPASADGRINLNTAPRAVLEALLDRRDLPYDFWRRVLEYRNEPLEDEDPYGDDPLFEERDEYGQVIEPKQVFGSADDLSEIDSWVNIEPATQGVLQSLLKTQSSVFTIFVTARRPTGEESIEPGSRKEDIEREEAEGQGLVRTVRSVVWRRTSDGGDVDIIPIVRWEVVDYVPYTVEDFPGEDR